MDRVRSQPPPSQRHAFARVAAVEIDAVGPSQHGFMLSGQGDDGGEYRLAMDFDLRLDPRTRSVLGELLSQSEITISRRGTPGNS